MYLNKYTVKFLLNYNIQSVFIIRSIVIRSLILVKQMNIKEFLAGSSIINIRIILFSFVFPISINNNSSERLLSYSYCYINIYILTSLIIYIL